MILKFYLLTPPMGIHQIEKVDDRYRYGLECDRCLAGDCGAWHGSRDRIEDTDTTQIMLLVPVSTKHLLGVE